MGMPPYPATRVKEYCSLDALNLLSIVVYEVYFY